jgi:hypothetical protein
LKPEQLTFLVSAAVVVAVALLLTAVIVRVSRRRQISLKQVLRRISAARLVDVLIPDGLDGEIHLDHLLLTPQGLVVVDIRNVHGSVFGGEQMDDWTVLSSVRRYTFRNPLGALAARVHAVRRLAGQVPVTGRVVLVGQHVDFPGGHIPGVITLPDLEQEFGAEAGAQSLPAAEVYRDFWQKVVAASRRNDN